jgi:hypothetical protein
MSRATPGNDENLWGRFPTCPTVGRQVGQVGNLPHKFAER